MSRPKSGKPPKPRKKYKDWPEEQKERQRIYNKKYKEEHLDERRAYHKVYTRQWAKENAEKVKEYNKIWRDNNPDAIYARSLRAKYGLTWEMYCDMVRAHNEVCAICYRPQLEGISERLFVDHNHETGQVRGLLCNKCNWMIGKCEENTGILKSMIDYLETYNGKPNYPR